MPVKIDGVTHSGYWKLTPDDSDLTTYFVLPKENLYIYNSSRFRPVFDPGGAAIDITIDGTTVDHNGTALGSIDGIANYLELYR